MRRPRLLDLFAGAGGAAVGYDRAGFDVTGVDLEPQPDFPYRFIRGDALTFPLEGFDAIHASPPCQKWALASRYNGRDYPDLIAPIRARLEQTAVPWVIENVPRAPVRPDIRLCGCMFGLELPGIGQLRRQRHFETSWWACPLEPPHHHWGPAISVAGHGTPSWMRARTGHIGVAQWREVMGIGWMKREQLTEAIPPAYTEHVGRLLLGQLGAAEMAA